MLFERKHLEQVVLIRSKLMRALAMVISHDYVIDIRLFAHSPCVGRLRILDVDRGLSTFESSHNEYKQFARKKILE
jgi:hypothetical protein